MRAFFFDGTLTAVRDCPEPELADGMALVRVSLAGVCNTDLELVRGYMGFRGVLGHEFVGEVVEGPEPWRGRRVVGEINFACGECPSCREGLERHCPTRRVMGILDADGSFAEYVAIPVANLHAVPDSLSDEVAVFAEPLAAAFEILEQLQPTGDERCVVMGDGKLGLLIAQVLDRAGIDVLAVGRHDTKLAILEKRGISTAHIDTWRPADENADWVVEATGSPDGIQRALAATRPRGTVVLKSTVAGAHAVDWSPAVIDEIQIVGSRCGPFPPALQALEREEINVRSLISIRLPLERAREALEQASQRHHLKVLLECRAS